MEFSTVVEVINALKALDENALLGAEDRDTSSQIANLWDMEIERLNEKVEKLKRQKARLNERLKKMIQRQV